MTKRGQREIVRVEGANGGKGILQKELLLTKEQAGEHCGLFGHIVLEEGGELGYHEHHGETETYYVLRGTGVYNDNGREEEVSEGDVFFCEDGCGHGIRNTGEGTLEFIALILK